MSMPSDDTKRCDVEEHARCLDYLGLLTGMDKKRAFERHITCLGDMQDGDLKQCFEIVKTAVVQMGLDVALVPDMVHSLLIDLFRGGFNTRQEMPPKPGPCDAFDLYEDSESSYSKMMAFKDRETLQVDSRPASAEDWKYGHGQYIYRARVAEANYQSPIDLELVHYADLEPIEPEDFSVVHWVEQKKRAENLKSLLREMVHDVAGKQYRFHESAVDIQVRRSLIHTARGSSPDGYCENYPFTTGALKEWIQKMRKQYPEAFESPVSTKFLGSQVALW